MMKSRIKRNRATLESFLHAGIHRMSGSGLTRRRAMMQIKRSILKKLRLRISQEDGLCS